MRVVIRMFSFLLNSTKIGCSIDVPKGISRFVLVTKVFLTLEELVPASNNYSYVFYAHHFPLSLLLPTSSALFQNSDPLVLHPPITKFLSALNTCLAHSQFWVFMHVFPVFEPPLFSLPHTTHSSFRSQSRKSPSLENPECSSNTLL